MEKKTGQADKAKTGYFEECPGVKSSTRLMSFLLLLFFMAFNLLYFFANANAISMDLILFDFLLLVGVFAPKQLQKIEEIKGIINNRQTAR